MKNLFQLLVLFAIIIYSAMFMFLAWFYVLISFADTGGIAAQNSLTEEKASPWLKKITTSGFLMIHSTLIVEPQNELCCMISGPFINKSKQKQPTLWSTIIILEQQRFAPVEICG